LSAGAHWPSPVWIARIHLDWAEALLDQGETDRARQQLDDAERAVGSLDLAENLDRLADLRSRSGTPPNPRRPPTKRA